MREKLVDRSSAARIPTMWVPFTAYCYRSILEGMEHIAMVKVREISNYFGILSKIKMKYKLLDCLHFHFKMTRPIGLKRMLLL